MHIIVEKDLVINHNSDWSGDVRIAWAPRGWPADHRVDGPPPTVEEWWVDGRDLLQGRITFSPKYHWFAAMPIDVACRAVARAVRDYMHTKAVELAEQVWTPK